MRKEGERVMQLPTSLPLGLEPRASTSQTGQLPNMYLQVSGGSSERISAHTGATLRMRPSLRVTPRVCSTPSSLDVSS